ncbi:MAG: GNAT family N-acetyltransferase, partial [Anaerolineae bacterium]|nr:GNAT family N-acetyltransferase [Anaerolineae bacterium]
MKITIYNSTGDFERLQPVWDDLLRRSAHNLFFMTYHYQRIWWQHLGRGDLRLMAVFDDDDHLVGLAPLFCELTESGLRQLNFVGCVDVSDYLDLLVDTAHTEQVYETLLDCLAGEAIEWDVLSLCSLPHDSPTHSRFAAAARRRGWAVEVRQQTVCPVITLAASWDEYLAGISKKQRHEIRRKIRRLEAEAESRWVVVESKVEIAAAMPAFFELHRKSTRDKEDFWDADLLRFFEALARQTAASGHFKLYFIELNGVQAAALLCFDYDNQFLLYNSGYDPEQFAHLSPGNVLISYTIQDAIRLGRSRYDFLR